MPSSPPSGLTVTTVSDSRLDLEWTNNDTYDTIHIYRSENGASYDEIGPGGLFGSTTSYSNTGLNDNKHYWYKICGVEGAESCGGQHLSDPDDDWTKPSTPTNQRQSTTTPTSIRIYWNNSAYAYTQIYVDGALNATEDPGEITHKFTGLSEDTEYSVKIRHYNLASGHYSTFTSAETYSTGAEETSEASETLSISDSISEVLGSVETDTLTVTDSLSEAGEYADTISDDLSFTDSGAGVATSSLELGFRYYFGGFDGEIYAEGDDYKSDNGVDIDVVYETNQIDFADQNGEMIGKWATVYQIKLWYQDVSENTTFRCLVSNDGGTTWTQQTKTVGTGDDTNKSVDFYFILTGHHFKFKVQNVSSDTDFRLINMTVYYLPRGQAFNV